MEYLIWIILVVATVIPMIKLLPHFGINKNWAFACVIPRQLSYCCGSWR